MTDPRLLGALATIERRMKLQTDALGVLSRSIQNAGAEVAEAASAITEFVELLTGDEEVCWRCGQKVSEATMVCPECAPPKKSRAGGDTDPAGS